jgi:hypothetical protein
MRMTELIALSNADTVTDATDADLRLEDFGAMRLHRDRPTRFRRQKAITRRRTSRRWGA